ncbi:CDP-glycerol glycerophosphotransferase family protein [Flavobacterium denitrificans]|uniref:CDP-glycerol glycerophosphotransferase family protein n=1 Tax=Flavobacterium denitrificans TaxID=281361 RepID=UPI000402D9D6|nr:CDP-glycerol glycerophosphotransferase family protein [Flavobacterium denitrificans]
MNIKNILKILIFPFTRVLYLISGLIPRNPKIWVFGAQKNAFNDNTKYLFISLTMERPDIKAIWITSNRETIKKIRNNSGLAYYRWSLKGIIYTILAKYWFVTTTVAEIDYYTSRGATVINLWHGIPIKKIYFDTDNVEDFNRYHNPSFIQKWIDEPSVFRLSNYMVSTSNHVSVNVFCSALKVELENCLNFGQARTDIFFFDDQKYNEWVNKWESNSFISIIDRAKKSNYVWIYMPTWRESNPSFLDDMGLNYDKINKSLSAKDELLIMKLHPYTPIDFLNKLKGYSNIVVVESSQDIYPLLKFTDALITDYSSIFIDYLLLNKPIVFYCFDLEDYILSSRGFYYDYSEVTPGIKVKSTDDLENLLCLTKTIDSKSDDQIKINKLFYDYMDGKSSHRITNFFDDKKDVN